MNMLSRKLNAMQFLKMVVSQETDGPVYQVFPIDQTVQSASVMGCLWKIYKGMRCMCEWRISFQAQCEHELFVDKMFIEEKWHCRWYNDCYWTYRYVNNNPICRDNGATNANSDLATIDDREPSHLGQPEQPTMEIHDIGPRNPVLENTNYQSSTVTYSALMKLCQTFCNMVQHDKKKMGEASIIMETMIERSRNKLSLVASFDNASDLVAQPASTNRAQGNPQPMGTNYPKTRNTKRKMSAAEQQMMRRRPNCSGNAETVEFQDDDVDDESEAREFGPTPRRKMSKTCGLCRQQGHKVTNCPALERFPGTLLPIRRPCSRDVREQLAVELSIPQKFQTNNREEKVGKVIHHSFPRRNDHDCIVVHRRLFINKDLPMGDTASNYCFECTLLQGTIHGVQETVSRGLFTLSAVISAITSNQNSLVKSELHLAPLTDMLSQPSQGLTQESSA